MARRRPKKFIQSAIRKPGALRRTLHAKAGQPIPARKLQQALHSQNPTTRKRAVLARTLKKLGRRKRRM